MGPKASIRHPHRMPYLCMGLKVSIKHTQDVLSMRVNFREKAMWLVAGLRKDTCKRNDSMGSKAPSKRAM